MDVRPNPRRLALFCAVGLALTGAGCGLTGRNSSIDSLTARSKAEKQFAEAKRKLKNPSKVYLAYARVQEQEGQPNQARTNYELVLQEEPKSLDAMLGLARLDHLAGRHREAERRYRLALETHPKNPYAHDAIGQFLADRKRWDEALPALDQAVALAPEESILRYHRAVALARSGNFDAARSEFVRTMSEAEAHYNVGYLLREQGRHEEAEREFAAAVQLQPDLQQARQMLAEYRGDEETTDVQLAGAETEAEDGRRQAVRHADANVGRRVQRANAPAAASPPAAPRRGRSRAGGDPASAPLTPTQIEQLRNQQW